MRLYKNWLAPASRKISVVTVNSKDNKVLFSPAKVVNFPLNHEVKLCIQTMKDAFFQLKSPYGLAANQLGFPWRIFLYYIPEKALNQRKDAHETVPLSVLINPKLEPVTDEVCEDWEACFSVPEMQGKVIRNTAISYHGQDEFGNSVSGKARGFLARIMQHEMDHLEGIVYTDRLNSSALYGPYEEMAVLEAQELEYHRLDKSSFRR